MGRTLGSGAEEGGREPGGGGGGGGAGEGENDGHLQVAVARRSDQPVYPPCPMQPPPPRQSVPKQGGSSAVRD